MKDVRRNTVKLLRISQ